MLKRALDVIVSAIALVAMAPIMLLAAIGIRISSPGPILYRADRVGLDARRFIMHKFRTMDVRESPDGVVITAPNDRRIFPFGSLLRKLKIDELPQLWDVLRGEMSIVGPRPEDPLIVRDHYTPEMLETLKVRPGLTSPGSLYGSTHGDRNVTDDDPVGSYIRDLLPIKLAIERVYVDNRSLSYDLNVVLRTVSLLAMTLAGRREFTDPPELRQALEHLKVSGDAVVMKAAAASGK